MYSSISSCLASKGRRHPTHPRTSHTGTRHTLINITGLDQHATLRSLEVALKEVIAKKLVWRRRSSGQAKILLDIHMRVERVILKDHGDVAIPRGNIIDYSITNLNRAARRSLQPSDHPQRCALPTTTRTNKHRELAVWNAQIA